MKRIASLLTLALLTGCAGTASTFPVAVTQRTSAERPAGAWLCGSSPSAGRGVETAPAGGPYTSLYKFKAGNDGGYPYGELVAVNGKLYGTTDVGGTHGYGTIYQLTTSGQERVVYSFKGGNDGAYPCGGVVALNGKLYGATQAGGSTGWGTLFWASTTGQEHVIYTFKAGGDGAAPYGRLLLLGGKLYGTTVEGGVNGGWGTVFVSSPNGPARVIYRFKAGSDGGYPYGKLIALNDTLYGTTMQGGTAGWGTVFSLTTAGKERVLHSFKAGQDGGYPFDGLTRSAVSSTAPRSMVDPPATARCSSAARPVKSAWCIHSRAARTVRIRTPRSRPWTAPSTARPMRAARGTGERCSRSQRTGWNA